MISLRRKADPRLVRSVAGWCLQYPDEVLLRNLPVVRDAAESLSHKELLHLIDHIEGTEDIARHYVDAFDSRPRRCLYMTWYADGDTRRRGASLVRLKQIYRAHGMVPPEEELPDFLPVVLEFATTGDQEVGEQLLTEFRPGLRLLADNLGRFGSPYELAVRAVLATLPQGRIPLPMVPPTEQVGLDPYPMSLPGAHR
ncbi:nitrate reductase molybdenum cofactor assembly chaperone [Allokutzneria sp. NRRL B-24872]|uniref:nitrate reductase molybdenum cofactor assembly chaperone n=1 Tax=Allokutzneria sp. NRRL B-24872 TaxID=1137961 RepID=UPI000A3D5A5D|nr:nitrate reductase molybdenum cofactor assembly chaperone [Allokutzneria sp. NRRL B-24872]